MIAQIIWITIIMWIVAIFAFSPLGYFIYMYTFKSGEPFGNTEPHGDSESLVLDLVEIAINKAKELMAKR